MKLLSQIWTMPNHLEFEALYEGRVMKFKGLWYQKDNKAYEYEGVTYKCTAIPFFAYKENVFFGKIGETHDAMFAALYPQVNDPSLEIVYERAPKCLNFRKAEVFRQQGRLFIFDIGEERICIVTMCFDCPTLDLFEAIKAKVQTDCYYIHKNKLEKL